MCLIIFCPSTTELGVTASQVNARLYLDIATDASLRGDACIDGTSEYRLGEISVDPWVYSANIGDQFR